MIQKKYYKLVKVSYEDSGYFYIKNTSNQTGTLTIRSQQYSGQNPTNAGFEYSRDGVNWSEVTGNPYYDFTLEPNANIYFRGNYDSNVSQLYRPNFKMNVSHIIGGNILSLADKTNFTTKTTLTNQSVFYHMFSSDTNLTSAKNLNFGNLTTLTKDSCNSMFYNCASLTEAPELPATTLANDCYYAMFQNCTSLTVAPELPSATLPNACYAFMFNGCSSLNTIKCLATDISVSNCTQSWVVGVSATGTFYKDANMNDWTTDSAGVPYGWTVVDA